MLNQILKLLAVLLLGVTVGFLLTPKQDKEYIQDLERKRAEYFQNLKEMDILKKRLHSHDSVWMEISKRHKDTLEIQQKNLTLLKNENKRLKNRPVPNWTSQELDSVISIIIND